MYLVKVTQEVLVDFEFMSVWLITKLVPGGPVGSHKQGQDWRYRFRCHLQKCGREWRERCGNLVCGLCDVVYFSPSCSLSPEGLWLALCGLLLSRMSLLPAGPGGSETMT